ncbi:MAG: amidohydrolase family protein [Cytophagaceae bacterium]|nr:amidohydrolase family protein [Gemmatimonadaceae bacterium]
MVGGLAGAAHAQSSADSLTLDVFHVGRRIGTEVTRFERNASGSTARSSLAIVDRGTPLQLTSELHLAPDFAPSRFTASGRSYRFVEVDVDVVRQGDSLDVRVGVDRARIAARNTGFMAQGWAPLSGRAAMIARWEKLGRPAALRVVPPTREVTIAFRGVDTVQTAGLPVVLRRYVVDNVVWGRETAWLDASDRLAAIVTRIHILPMTAVRQDLRESLPALHRRAVADRMDDLAAWRRRTAPVASGTFALQGATIVDATGAPPLADATIVIRDGRIAAIGRRASVAIPPGARVVDVRGKTIVPGLWEMHAHASQIEWAPAYLAAGVTTARDMGGEGGFLFPFRDAIDAGRGLGPRLLIAGLVDGGGDGALGVVDAATPEEGRAVVDRHRSSGVQQVKLYTLLAPDVVRAITDRAHALGMTVTGHVPRALGLAAAIEAGMDQVAHLPTIGSPDSAEGRAAIAMLARRKVVVDPTLPWNELLRHAPETAISSFEPGFATLPAPLAASYLSVNSRVPATAVAAELRLQLNIIKALHDAGVPIVAGTDGAIPGHSLLRSIELFAQAGLTPMEALQSATIVPARAMGLANESGTLEVGKRADLLVLDANPLERVSNIRNGRWVVANGRMYETAALWKLAGFKSR